MSQDLEKNKVFAAILVAGIVAMLCGFVARLIVHPAEHGEVAIEIDTSSLESASSGDVAPAGPEPVLALLAGADLKKGESLSKACLACHTFGNGEANKVGPNLYNVVNAKVAHRSDFAYSDALKSKGENWTYQNLNRFLWKPSAYAPGTKMAFPGLKKPQDRADVIAYLRSQASSPAPLPSETEIAAEAPKEAEAAEVTDAATDAAQDVKTSGTSATTDGTTQQVPNDKIPLGGVKDQGDKEVVDEAQASEAARNAAGVEEKPVQNAVDVNQSRGDKNTSGKANPALTPQTAE